MSAPKPSPSLAMAREAMQAGDPAGALALLQDMPPKLQARPNVQALAASAHFALGQDQDALAAIRAARTSGADGQWVLQLLARIQTRIGDQTGRAETLAELVERFPQDAGAHRQLAMQHLGQGDLAAAAACVAAMPATGQGAAWRLALGYQIAVKRGDAQEITRILHAILAECETCPDLPNLRPVLAELPPDVGQDLAGRLIARWPEMAPQLQARRSALDPSQQPRQPDKQALILALTGRAEEAGHLLATDRAAGPELAEAAAMIAGHCPAAAADR